jgi:transposase InsO family protein
VFFVPFVDKPFLAVRDGTFSPDALQNVLTGWVTQSGAYALESDGQTGAALRVGETDAAAPSDMGSTETAAQPREEVRPGRPAGGGHAQPVAQAVGAGVRPARDCHEVWTVDFKGWYRTGDGRRVDPLTVRDLHSSYILRIGLLTGQGLAQTRREFDRIFREHGLPERIRCDNGTPFGGGGPTGLTRLSAWWFRLEIAVEFTTPGRRCENGAHEQFHRVYKAEVARSPARHRHQK